MNHEENMRRAQYAYDNLTPEDLTIPQEAECVRCSIECPIDDLRHVESLGDWECAACVSHGSGDAVGIEWRRSCSECCEVFGAKLVTKEGWRQLCWGCRQIEANGMRERIEELQHRLKMFLERRVEGANSDYP